MRSHSITWKRKFLIVLIPISTYGRNEDAIILQCALSAGCKEIVSFDSDFDNIKEIKRIEP